VRVAVEAAVRFGWDALIGDTGIFVGMTGFGASAPYKDLYRHFGITAEAVAERMLSLPIFPEMRPDQVERVVAVLAGCIPGAAARG